MKRKRKGTPPSAVVFLSAGNKRSREKKKKRKEGSVDLRCFVLHNMLRGGSRRGERGKKKKGRRYTYHFSFEKREGGRKRKKKNKKRRAFCGGDGSLVDRSEKERGKVVARENEEGKGRERDLALFCQ